MKRITLHIIDPTYVLIHLLKSHGYKAQLWPRGDIANNALKEEYICLSDIMELFYDRYRTNYTTADKLFFDQIEEELVTDEKLQMQAKANTIDNFKYSFEDLFITKLIDRMEGNQELFEKIIDDKDFGEVVRMWMLKKVYQRLTTL